MTERAGPDLGRGVGWALVSLVAGRGSAVVVVSLVLHDLGTDLYAAWVLAGTLIMAQGLLDFGVGAAMVRFVAVGATAGSRAVVLTVLRRAAVFYGLLSLLVAVPLIGFAREIVDLVPFLNGVEADGAAVLFRYAGCAFVLTNAVLILDGLLRGVGRVAASYRAQTVGWLFLAPMVGIGVLAGWGVHGPGLAWLVTYGVQIALLAVTARRELRTLPGGVAPIPTFREMAGIGGRWQVSSWADFATFQLPRLVGGLALSSSALVSIDLAMRLGQLVVAPLLALYPVVLPAATSTYAEGGRRALASQVSSWYLHGTTVTVLATAVLLPIAPPVIATWSGHVITQSDVLVAALVLLGIVAHASTGLLSSSLLAVGEIGAVVAFKLQQLTLALVLLAAGAALGEVYLAGAVFLSLALPALRFNWRAASELQMASLATAGIPWSRLVAIAIACVAGLGVVMVLAGEIVSNPVLAAGGSVLGAGALLLAVNACGIDVRSAWNVLRQLIASRGDPRRTVDATTR